MVVPDAGPVSVAADWLEINIHGKGGHGAMPEFSVDPLNVLSHLHVALQELASSEISASDGAVVTIGMMAGGSTANIIRKPLLTRYTFTKRWLPMHSLFMIG